MTSDIGNHQDKFLNNLSITPTPPEVKPHTDTTPILTAGQGPGHPPLLVRRWSPECTETKYWTGFYSQMINVIVGRLITTI